MRASPIVLMIAVTALVGHAQTPLFQVLDGPLPQQGSTASTLGDLDGDGDQDLAGLGAAFLNDGHGRFIAVPVPGLNFPRSRSVLVDVNGDGYVDMVSSTYSGPMRIDIGGPALAFAPSPFPFPALPGPFPSVHNFAVGDVDLDGDADILIAPFVYSPMVAPPVLWLNNGAGQFSLAPAGALPVLNLHGTYLLLRDLDNDGDPDAIFAGSSNTPAIQILINTGGTFAASPAWQWSAPILIAFDVGDFNGDGLTDIVYSRGVQPNGIIGTVVIVLNSGQGLVAGGTLNNVYFNAIRAVDVNGDGVDEIVGQGSGSSGLSLHGVSSVPPTVGPATQSWPGSSLLLPGPGHETIYDLDGDGDRDVVTLEASQPALLMNDGVGGLVRVGGRTAGVGPLARPLAGELDLDGDLDLLGFTQYPTAIATATNAGDGFFASGTTAPIALPVPNTYYYSLYAFDRDGDGDSDVYAARNIFSALSSATQDFVFDHVGGTFVQSAIVTGTGDTSVFKTADLDADGDLDIILGRRNSTTTITNPMVLLVNNGAGGLGSPVSIGGNHATYDLEIGDFDGNGTPDVFQANNTGGNSDPCAVYLFGPNLTYTVVPQTFGAFFTASGDLNGDGMTDLIADGQVLFAIGGGAFVAGTPLLSALAAPATLADVDLDGDLDLFEAPGTVMFNAGGGVFGLPVSYLPRNTAYASTDLAQPMLADVDRDGDLDVVASGPMILLNTTRQIAHGSIARPGRPASIDLYGTPGGAWFLWGSNATAAFSLPPFGTVFIDPASAQLGAMGQFAPAGTASVVAVVPNNPALVGWTTYWQSVDASQMRLTNRITITVMGY